MILPDFIRQQTERLVEKYELAELKKVSAALTNT